jgi:hypothetical protein
VFPRQSELRHLNRDGDILRFSDNTEAKEYSVNKTKTYRLTILALAVLVYVGTSHASSSISTRSIIGNYGFSGSGTLGAGTIQAAVVGVTTFGRGGRCKITGTINAVPLVPHPVPVSSTSCTYTLNSDGTGTQDVTFDTAPFTGPFHSDFVVVDEGEEIPFMLSDATGGTVATGVAKRQTDEERN